LTLLNESTFGDTEYGAVAIADIHWGNVNIAVVGWSAISKLGDEKKFGYEFKYEPKYMTYERAARAYRQLSVVLRNQGLNENAARFTYRAQLMQRKIFWYRRKYLQYLGSLFLDLLSGYGYKPLRCFAASMTSFHGRGFFPGSSITLDDPLTVVAALEAFIGLLIEVTLIATLTQRLFGR